jgi:ribose-phosphate pyrophosphokinase
MLHRSRHLTGLLSASFITYLNSHTTRNEPEVAVDVLVKQPTFGATVNLRKKKSATRVVDLDSILIIPGSAHPKLATEISELIDVPTASVIINRFTDGECNVMINDSIRGKDVFIIQTCAAPVNDNVMELLLTISCARRCGAKRINAVIPYFGYKHHRRSAPISTKNGSRFLASGAMDFAKMMTEMGVDRVIAVDLQRPGQGSEACFFDNVVPLETIGTSQYQMDFILANVTLSNPVVVVAPNGECVKKARQCQDILEKRLNQSIKVSCFFQSDSSSGPTDAEQLHTLDGMDKVGPVDNDRL